MATAATWVDGLSRAGARARRTLLAGLLLAALPPAQAASPTFNYLLHCAGCHLEDGAGMPPEVPDLGQDLHRFAMMPGGRSYLVRVPGSAQSPLSDQELAEVLNWILTTYYPDQPPPPPFTAAEVKALRGIPLADPFKLRRQLMNEH